MSITQLPDKGSSGWSLKKNISKFLCIMWKEQNKHPQPPKSMHIPMKSQEYFHHRNKYFALEALTNFSSIFFDDSVCSLHFTTISFIEQCIHTYRTSTLHFLEQINVQIVFYISAFFWILGVPIFLRQNHTE